VTEVAGKDSAAWASPEVRLILATARVAVDAERVQQIQELCSLDLDWDAVLRLARRHRTTPLLYRTLTVAGGSCMPGDRLSQLRLSFLNNTQHSLMLARELLKVVGRLQEHEVPVLAFRGPVLAESVYGSLSLRQFSDLDVLLHKEDILRARDVLSDLGYSTGGMPASEAARLETMYHYTLKGREGAVHLELHWQFAPRYFGASTDSGLWQRTQWIELEGQRVPALGDEDLLLALCVHGSKHTWSQLSWICDVAELIHARPGLDWRAMVERSRRLEAERMLALGLHLADSLLGAQLPPQAVTLVDSDREIEGLAQDVARKLFVETRRLAASQQSLLLKDFHLRLRESRWRRLRHLARTALIPTHEDWAALALPRSLSFLYYLTRPLRLTAKHVGRLLARLGGSAGERRDA
jgi:hypothetical protein